MFFSNPRSILSEAAATDLLEVEGEVKDVVDELQDDLDDIEIVKPEDMTTNGGIPVVSEAVSLMRSSNDYNGARYLVSLESVMAVMESEGEKAAEEDMDTEEVEAGEAPTPEDVEEHEPHPANVVEDIAARNGVDPEEVAVVISSEAVAMLAEHALLEAKVDRKGKNAKGTKKMNKVKKVIDDLKGNVKLLVAKKK